MQGQVRALRRFLYNLRVIHDSQPKALTQSRTNYLNGWDQQSRQFDFIMFFFFSFQIYIPLLMLLSQQDRSIRLLCVVAYAVPEQRRADQIRRKMDVGVLTTSNALSSK